MIGTPELVIILVIVLLVFGAGKLPQVFSQLGKGVKEFREAAEVRDNNTANPPPPATPTTTTTAPTAEKNEQEVREVHDTIVKN
jgi:sec-independent protein translocase protein TatA